MEQIVVWHKCFPWSLQTRRYAWRSLVEIVHCINGAFIVKISSTGTPNHSRTGSSPAVIQQQIQVQSGNPATRYVFYNLVPNFTFFCANVINVMCRTNTYPKIPERFRLRSSDNYPLSSGTTANSPVPQTYQYSPSTHSMGAMSSTPPPLVPARNTAHHESTGQRTSSPISSRHPSLQSPPKSSDTTTSKSDSNNKAKEEEVMYFWYTPVEVEI